MGIAAILSLITGLAPVIPAIKGMIQGAENAVGPGKGDQKKQAVVQSIVPFAKLLKDKGVLPADVDIESLGPVVDVIFSLMKTGNELSEQGPGVQGLGLKKGVAYPITIEGVTKGTIKLAVEP